MKQRTKTVLGTLAVLGGLSAVAAGATVVFGLYNVSARSDHFRPTYWALHTTYLQSVELRAGHPPSPQPDLEDPALIELGARHFVTACAMCHAVPGELQSATVRQMNPEPPHITDAVGDWTPEEMHWIVYEGVKMSGMPHWPSVRTDDVWSTVAYLRAVQTGMVTPEKQVELTARPDIEGPDDVAWCAGCHGGVKAHVPRLDIFDADYISVSLTAYREGRRESGIMSHAASQMSPEALDELASWFAAGGGARNGLDRPAAGSPEAPEVLARGEALARMGTDDVPACTACHGPGKRDLSGFGGDDVAGDFPPLAGQDQAYLRDQLRIWRDGVRGGTDVYNLMRVSAQGLSDADIDALAAWYAAQPPSTGAAAAATGD